MSRRARSLGGFFYDFVVGDDPMIAVLVVLALGVTGALAHAGVSAWWLLPVVVVAVLGMSLSRAVR